MLPDLLCAASFPRFGEPVRPSVRRLLTCSAASLLSLCSLAILTYVYGLWVALPQIHAEDLALEQSIQLLDARGDELHRIYRDQDRIFEPKESIPAVARQAMIAIEDERFYTRPCIDIRAVLRAVRANATQFKSQGGSTITQQLVRNIFLTRDKSIARKVQEIMLACSLERQMSKDDILAMYLNDVPFGQNVYGIANAAQTYFGKPLKDISVAQAAVLASLPQRPSYFTPYGGHLRTTVPRALLVRLRKGQLTQDAIPESQLQPGLLGRDVPTRSGTVIRLKGRSDYVLMNMLRLGSITRAQYDAAERELATMTFQPQKHTATDALHFSLLVRKRLWSLMDQQQKKDAWMKAGLHVTTTLRADLQSKAEESVSEVFPRIAAKMKASNMALVAVDRRTREVVAYIGNSDYDDNDGNGKIDMAQVPRQPGSSFKPLVYAAALAQGYKPYTPIEDSPLRIGDNTPKNYEGGYKGWMTVRTALAGSRNIPAIRAYQYAGGEDTVLSVASRLGVVTPSLTKEAAARKNPGFSYGWPLAIGSAETPLLEMVQAYATIANHGEFRPLHTVKRITDAWGKQLYVPPDVRTQAIDADVADELTDILSDEWSRPAGYWRDQLHMPGLPAAVKTGTSNLCLKRVAGNCTEYGVNNTWALGYTDDLVVGVWVGNADNSPLDPKADGLNAAVPIWKDFLLRAHEGAAKDPAPGEDHLKFWAPRYVPPALPAPQLADMPPLPDVDANAMP
jgi:membrane peptidoglycan carboxypeptidase